MRTMKPGLFTAPCAMPQGNVYVCFALILQFPAGVARVAAAQNRSSGHEDEVNSSSEAKTSKKRTYKKSQYLFMKKAFSRAFTCLELVFKSIFSMLFASLLH